MNRQSEEMSPEEIEQLVIAELEYMLYRQYRRQVLNIMTEDEFNNFVEERIDGLLYMQIFMHREATNEEINRLGEELLSIEGINHGRLITSEEAFEIMRERLGARQHLMTGLEATMFPPSYVVRIEKLFVFRDVYHKVNELENIDYITSQYNLIQEAFSNINR